MGLFFIPRTPPWSPESFDDFYKFLSKREDVDIEAKPRHYPDYGDKLYYALFFHDPDGLRLEVFYEEH